MEAKEGEKLVSQLQADKEHYGAYAPGAQSAVPLGENDASINANFPRSFFKTPAGFENKLEDYKFLRDQMGVTLQASPDKFLLEAFQQQRNAKELEDFDTYITQKFDLTDPLVVKNLREIYPAYFEARLKVVDDKLSNIKRFAKIEMLGPEDLDDHRFQYLAEKGHIVVPMNAVNFLLGRIDAAGAETDYDAQRTAHFNRGLLNSNSIGDRRVTGKSYLKDPQFKAQTGRSGPGFLKTEAGGISIGKKAVPVKTGREPGGRTGGIWDGFSDSFKRGPTIQ